MIKQRGATVAMCWESPSDSDMQHMPDTDTRGGFKWVARS